MKAYKCDHCGENATHYYKTNINGKVTEQHLCSECAAKVNAKNDFFSETDRLFSGFDNLFDSFFPSFGRSSSLFAPFDLMMPAMMMPRLCVVAAPADGALKIDPSANADKSPKVDPALDKKRRINMLKAEMHKAVKTENFEKAAELRDQIKKLETAE